jgi:SAM-dependent methyltransferase
MRVTEKLLLLLSRKPESNDYPVTSSNLNNALDLLCNAFPHILDDIKDKIILDLGCGSGAQAIELVNNGAMLVVGVDINPKALEKAKNAAKREGIENQTQFKDVLGKNDKERFDIIISQNSMEHFKDPLSILSQMKTSIKKGGQIYITFGPPWFAPYGSHMQFFTKMPWVNILFSEKTVMNVRRYFRQDGAMKYEDVESGLIKMSIYKFEKLVQTCGIKLRYKRYQCIKDLDFLSKIPLLRELVINRVNCILST